MGLNDRPQDAGRRHRRKGTPNAATRALLDRYQEAMRRDLGRILDELEPVEVTGTSLLGDPLEAPGIDVKRAAGLYDLAIRLANQLGTAIDPTPMETAAGVPYVSPKRSRAKVDMGGA